MSTENDSYGGRADQLDEIFCEAPRYDDNGLTTSCGRAVTHKTPSGTLLCGRCAVRWTQDEHRKIELGRAEWERRACTKKGQ
jgi:hypothetical protein